ncbi:MAG: HNH endonuclease [Planctomycetes bacterium]|nr:HNH endonuclease [Planctomycetota bacterium]
MLLLNAHYIALRVVTVRRAFTLLFKRDDGFRPMAEVIHVENGHYFSFDFDDWADFSQRSRLNSNGDYDWVRTVRFSLAVPRIIRVFGFARVPRQAVKFNRRTVLARDRNTCQYCLRRFPPVELTLDHVVPRSQNGSTTWENVVAACHRCNVRKGGRTPAQAGLRLTRAPVRPKCNPLVQVNGSGSRYEVWQPFLEQARWDVQSA